MAKARRTATRTRTITRTVRAPAPIIRVSAPRAATKKRHRRRGSHGGGTHALVGGAVGGAVYGFIERHYSDVIPTVPFIGRAGAVAIACHFAGKRGFGGSIVRDLGLAAAVIAGYQLGTQGHINGEIAPQVRGVAAQV